MPKFLQKQPPKSRSWRLGRAIALGPWAYLAVVFVAVVGWYCGLLRLGLLGFYFLLTLTASGAALAAYWLDKRQAEKSRRRISEKTLQTLAIGGGWPGALLGRRIWRHKTKKQGFSLQLMVIVAAHLLLLLVLTYFWLL